jgi:regulatory protein
LSDEVLAAALTALGRKERTEVEMRSWLAEREVSEEEIERVMAFLIENLAVDDRRFALGYAEDKRRLSGWGRSRIESVLRDRGISRELIDAALENDNGASEVERAAAVLIEKGSSLEGDRDRQRALSLLARRGFSAEDAYAAIRRASRESALKDS